jgi:4-amino-4-deoxy-L-arabinose transferase and related glycosyltransferases of PMT family
VTSIRPETGGLRPALWRNRYRLLAGALALVSGLAVFLVAHELFPYHSANHDEGVYLQQASMLLDGQLRLTPGPEPLGEAFRPWFFVESESGLYPKYTPVPAAAFALGTAAGGARLALFGTAVVNVALVYAVTAAAFDRPTGVFAAALFAGAPMFLFTSAVFLPYAPTTALNLLFLFAYVRAVRREGLRYAALAGTAAGLAFFSRPYTAVLFAVPLVVHALWRLSESVPGDRPAALRYVTVAATGSTLVAVTLAYNATLTGSPLLFPYEAFAPLDGLGFGQRRILGHDMVYTPRRAARANAAVLWTFATDWFTAGPLGTLAAAAGAVAAVLGVRREGFDATAPLCDRQLQVLLLAVVPVVVAGNVYFWGNANILGAVADPEDGLISLFGPFYHFDLLFVLSAFAAHGTAFGLRWVRPRARNRFGPRTVTALTLVCFVLVVPVVGAAQADALAGPAEKHASYTEKFEQAYAPLEEAQLENALVFLPPTYGEWRNHPFQWLRNDPDFAGQTLYALDRDPTDDLAVVSSYPDRAYYRYRYHGTWTPSPDDRVHPVLERVRIHETSAVTARTEVAIPDRVTTVSVSVSNGGAVRRYDYEGDPPGRLAVDWTVTPGGVTVENSALRARNADASPVAVDGPEEIVLAVTITEPGGGTLTYREEVLAWPADPGVAVLWPPESSVCLLVTDCGREGTYVPDRPDTRPDGTEMNTTLRDGNT